MKNVITETSFQNAESDTNEEFDRGWYVIKRLDHLFFTSRLRSRKFVHQAFLQMPKYSDKNVLNAKTKIRENVFCLGTGFGGKNLCKFSYFWVAWILQKLILSYHSMIAILQVWLDYNGMKWLKSIDINWISAFVPFEPQGSWERKNQSCLLL